MVSTSGADAISTCSGRPHNHWPTHAVPHGAHGPQCIDRLLLVEPVHKGTGITHVRLSRKVSVHGQDFSLRYLIAKALTGLHHR